MSFARFGPLGVLLGLAGLAGVLYLLHRLRVRHREHEVVTTLFWREAVEDVRARVLVRRFRQPLAYALMCAIAAALWLGVSGPSIEPGDVRDHVILLDASAGMIRGGRLADAVDAAQARVRALPRARTRVVVCGARPETALLPGEDEVLLAARLHDLQPASCPPTTGDAVRSILRAPHENPVTVHVIGDLPETVPGGANVVVEVTPIAAQDAPNAGITSIGVTPARSGRRGVVDVFVETRSDAGAAPEAVLSVAGRETVLLSGDDAVRQALHLDVPAGAGTVEARIAGSDAIVADDTASIRLPSDTPIRVRVDDALRPVIEAVTAAAPDLVLVDAAADVTVTRDRRQVDQPTLTVADPDAGHAIHVTHPGGRSAAAVLDEIVAALSLDAIDATGLARRAGRAVSVGVEPGDTRQLRVWPAFLGDDSALHAARTHPVFIAGALRWLAGRADTPSFAAAGERVPQLRGTLVAADGARQDALGAALTLPRAGDYSDERGETVSVSLSSPFVTTGNRGESAAPTAAPSGGGSTGLVTLLGVVALVLLLVEWMAHRTGRMA